MREFAVEVLRTASDAELLTFLLQLVQALRYEPLSSSSSSSAGRATGAVDFPLEGSIMGVNHSNGGSAKVQSSPMNGKGSRSSVLPNRAVSSTANNGNSNASNSNSEDLSPLANFLVRHSCLLSLFLLNYSPLC